ncbi:MAG: hypothetical protein ACOY5U_02370 [Pseudomonadota bacterium]
MTGPVETARAAWAAAAKPLPDWVEAMAQECARTSQNRVAERIGRSAAVVSQVLRAKYPGDLAAVEELFNGAFRGELTACPAKGTIPVDQCRHWREKARRFVNVNAERVAMYRACSACPRNRKEAADATTC